MKDHKKSGVEPCRSAEAVGEAGVDEQGALVERLRGEPDFFPWPERLLNDAADRIEAITRENAALRADKGRLERELKKLDALFKAQVAWEGDLAERRLAGRSSLAAPISQEPVAWRADLMNGDGGFLRKFTAMRRVAEIWKEQGNVVTPLYGSPQPLTQGEPSEAEVERVALKREDADCIRTVLEEFYHKHELSPEEERAFLSLCSSGNFGRPVRDHASGPIHAAKSKGGQADG